MERTIVLDGVKYRVLPVPVTRGQLKTSSAWNQSKTRVRPCNNTKVLASHLIRKRMLSSVPYGTEPVPRYS